MTEIVYSAKNKKNEYKKQGVFHSNAELAKIIKTNLISLCGGGEPEQIADFCCGTGNLLSVFENSEKYGLDIENEFVSYCEENKKGFWKTGDFLTDPDPFGRDFEAIVGNPPFSMRDPEKAKMCHAICRRKFSDLPEFPNVLDFAFLIKNIYHLTETGKAAIVMFPGVLYRGQKEAALRKWLIEKGRIKEIVFLSGQYFDDTNINICLLLIDRAKTDRAIVLRSDKDGQDWERLVSYEEIKKNNFSLSLGLYQEPPKKKTIDPVANIKFLSERMIKNIENHLKLCNMTDEFEKTTLKKEMLKEMKNLIKNEEGLLFYETD